jgi:hypothetical protein
MSASAHFSFFAPPALRDQFAYDEKRLLGGRWNRTEGSVHMRKNGADEGALRGTYRALAHVTRKRRRLFVAGKNARKQGPCLHYWKKMIGKPYSGKLADPRPRCYDERPRCALPVEDGESGISFRQKGNFSAL